MLFTCGLHELIQTVWSFDVLDNDIAQSLENLINLCVRICGDFGEAKASENWQSRLESTDMIAYTFVYGARRSVSLSTPLQRNMHDRPSFELKNTSSTVIDAIAFAQSGATCASGLSSAPHEVPSKADMRSTVRRSSACAESQPTGRC